MSKLRVTFTFTDHVDIDLAGYVGETMPDSRAIEIAREILAENYDDAGVGGAYLLLGDAGADIETVNDWGRE
jgi:hypothetical protein